jgi:hypothetical protein
MLRSGKLILGLAVLLLLCIPALLLASAGGGGGGGSSDSDSGIGALIELLLYLLFYLPFPWNLVAIGALIFILYLLGRNVKARSGLNNIASIEKINPDKKVITPAFLQRNPGFSEELFKEKATIAFNEIQSAWMRKDLRQVRRFISDGVYQRFHTQFRMMNALGQENLMRGIRINRLFIDAAEQDGEYSILHVGIHFEMEDDFVCKQFPQLNVAGHLENLEYWSFIKRSGVQEKNIYASNNCPNCGAALPGDGGETSKCAHCGTLSYLGDHDWVLSEIAQGDDYINEPKKLGKEGKKTGRLRQVLGQGTSVQLLEDKASNGYMQIMTALVEKRPELMRRFVTDEVYEKLQARINSEPRFLFNRLFLNDVTLVDLYTEGEQHNLVFAVKRSSQEVRIENGRLNEVNSTVVSENEILVMSRNKNAQAPKGALYAHTCPNCAAPVPDSIDIKCSYCGELLNSPRYEWIISGLYNAYEYQAYKAAHEPELVNDVDPELLDSLYEVRDYAINNVMIMVAADGVMAEQELQFVRGISRKWGYKPDRLNALYEMAMAKKLVLRMPENGKKKQKVYKLMEKAAATEGSVSPEEQAILDEVKKMLETAA